ncbi:MAG TPA: aminotransferase class III-fold pyridoxal phosphate-dependent enzyme [Gemmatimonadales bacterium]|nr:aminotransferase class III-fold pyridoxal phosphate-dependent enzyme [Gemmatimonadales bacterium]
MERIPGFSSTGSKRPEALYGEAHPPGAPLRMTSASGCRVRDAQGREYVDFVMALGAVALGYGDARVTRAVQEAAAQGIVGPLSPVLEEQVAGRLAGLMPWVEQVRFLKTGAEAVAAAIRIARVFTGRDRVIGCGYHGWLDGTQTSETAGVPEAIRAEYGTLRFSDPDDAQRCISAAGDRLAAVIVEPVIEAAPSAEWLAALRQATRSTGAVLIFDEIKTVGRVALGGAAERWGGEPDLVVMGKAIANGMPLAAVGGRRDLMQAAIRTWISSTLATEFVSLAAADATLAALAEDQVPRHLARVGGELLAGFTQLADRHPAIIRRAAGIPEMCFLEFASGDLSTAVVTGCARRGVLFKRSAYNFVSLAHDERIVSDALAVLEDVLREVRGR